MQEEIDHKTVNFAISTVKLSARTLLKGAQFFLRQYDKSASQGKQSMNRLIRQNRGVTNLEIEKTGIKDFDRYAKRYHIDYAIQKDLSCTPPRYLIFFKAQDTDALNAAFKEYSASVLSKTERPSVLAKLHNLAQTIANLPDKIRHKEEERGLCPLLHIKVQYIVFQYSFNTIYREKRYSMRSQFTSYEQLPITLTADHIAAALGISRANAYILLRSDGFPTLHIGKRMVVPKDRFLQWISDSVNS